MNIQQTLPLSTGFSVLVLISSLGFPLPFPYKNVANLGIHLQGIIFTSFTGYSIANDSKVARDSGFKCRTTDDAPACCPSSGT